jgi:hypothetical protein
MSFIVAGLDYVLSSTFRVAAAVAVPALISSSYTTTQEPEPLSFTNSLMGVVAGAFLLAATSLAINIAPLAPSKVRQVVQESPSGTKDRSMLVFSTSHDPIQASNTFIPDLRRFTHHFAVDLLEGEDKQSIKSQMSSNNKKYNTIVVHAHSNEHTIILARDTYLTRNSKSSLQWFRDHVQDGGHIVLHCCNAGRGDDNIARELSKACPHVTVYATGAYLNGLIGVEYTDDAIPSFNDGGIASNGMLCKGSDSTRIYRAGELV